MAKKTEKQEAKKKSPEGPQGEQWPYGLVLPPDQAGVAFSFPEALERLKRGHKMAREGWNGKGMWIAYTPGLVLPLKEAGGLGAMEHMVTERIKAKNEGPIFVLPRIDLRTADGALQIGWVASQSDLLACDWVVVG